MTMSLARRKALIEFARTRDAYLAARPQNKHGSHVYTAADYGLDADQMAARRNHFPRSSFLRYSSHSPPTSSRAATRGRFVFILVRVAWG